MHLAFFFLHRIWNKRIKNRKHEKNDQQNRGSMDSSECWEQLYKEITKSGWEEIMKRLNVRTQISFFEDCQGNEMPNNYPGKKKPL